MSSIGGNPDFRITLKSKTTSSRVPSFDCQSDEAPIPKNFRTPLNFSSGCIQFDECEDACRKASPCNDALKSSPLAFLRSCCVRGIKHVLCPVALRIRRARRSHLHCPSSQHLLRIAHARRIHTIRTGMMRACQSLALQPDNWVKPGRLAGRLKSEEYSDNRRHQNSARDRCG